MKFIKMKKSNTFIVTYVLICFFSMLVGANTVWASSQATYSYNAFGQRVAKTVDGVTTFYVYGEKGELLAEIDSSGNSVREYIYLEGESVAQVVNPNTSNQETYFVHNDHLNTPRVITDNNANTVWSIDTTPFGQVDYESKGSYENTVRFPGQYSDSESGYYYNYFRDYDPSLGRYVQSDPIGLNGGINTYGYAEGNPIRNADPLGLAVYLCKQPAFGWAPVDHHWIKTDTMEVGMGPVGGNGDAGNRSGDWPGDPVETTDHTGRSEQEGATCEEVPDVSESRVNDQLKHRRPLGNWGPTNQCQSFVKEVLSNAKFI